MRLWFSDVLSVLQTHSVILVWRLAIAFKRYVLCFKRFDCDRIVNTYMKAYYVIKYSIIRMYFRDQRIFFKFTLILTVAPFFSVLHCIAKCAEIYICYFSSVVMITISHRLGWHLEQTQMINKRNYAPAVMLHK